MTTSRTARLVALGVVTLAFAACDAPTMTVDEPGYDPRISGPPFTQPFIYHWDAGHEITIYVDPRNAPAETDLEGAVRAGIAAWTPVGRLGEISMRVVSDLHAADVIVHHSVTPRLGGSDQCEPAQTGAGGYTFFCIGEDSQPILLQLLDGSGGRIKMDVAINRNAVDADSVFRALVAHELGHVLGIGAHSPTATDLMFGFPRRVTPTLADERTLRYLLSRKPDVRF